MNKKNNQQINIVGAGISGLVAAKVLEDFGYKPTVIEATDRVGGRVKTDIIDGYQLDHGFQVLLTAYPAAKKYLNFDELNLQSFLPGATIINNKKYKTIGDPLRNISLLLPTLFAGIGSFRDKIKIIKLSTLLKRKSLSEIFKKTETTTLQYLIDFGFSSSMISKFFKPFFSGIFLEPHLETSSRMFEFIFKMFSEGLAALPKEGIEAIPKQLKAQLKHTNFVFNKKVTSIENNIITLNDGSKLNSDFIIIATEANTLITDFKKEAISWKSCHTLYFETDQKTIKKPLIGLVYNDEALINNIFYHTSLSTQCKGDKELLSVTVVKNHKLTNDALKTQIQKELKQYCGITNATFLKQYTITKALPKLENLQYEISPSKTKLKKGVFLAGDLTLNGSLNAAIISGEKAALGVVQAILDGL